MDVLADLQVRHEVRLHVLLLLVVERLQRMFRNVCEDVAVVGQESARVVNVQLPKNSTLS